jgi:protein O-GlcNAc transferase
LTSLPLSQSVELARRHAAAARWEAAELVCRAILSVAPHEPDALWILGSALRARGDLPGAEAALRAAHALRPDAPDLCNDLGMAVHAAGRVKEAEHVFRQALALRPNWAEALNNLAINLHTQQRLDEAEPIYRQSLAAAQVAVTHYNLGRLLQDAGRMTEAEAEYRQAIAQSPDHALAHYNLAFGLEELMQFAEAEAMYRQAIALAPGLTAAMNNLGTLLHELGRLDEAESQYRSVLTLQPNHCQAMSNLAAALRVRGQIDEAVALYDRALTIEPGHATTLGNRIACELYRPGPTLEALAELHAEWDRRHAAPLQAAWKPPQNDRDPNRRLRLGFVSSDLGGHPVGYFLVGVLEALERAEAAVYCYSSRLNEDAVSERIRAAADVWRRVRYVPDERLADMIRADRIDILFDLSGHTSGGRALLFARKPAPLQVAWLGYASTMGMAAIDYLIADGWEVPQEVEHGYRERILRMPDGYVCFWPDPAATAVGPLPALRQGCVTFGSCNNPAKIHGEVLALWAEILRRVPDARLLLAYGGIGQATQQERLCNALVGAGVDPARLELFDVRERTAVMGVYNRIDIGLDPFPYSGGVTTCEALWMGVPVVTWPGQTFASRHSLSHLSNVGLTDWIAADADEYVRLAVAAAADLPALAALRAGLRQRVADAPLCDAQCYAAAFQERMRRIWRQWLADTAAQS